jgi:hypothetical protein
MKDLFGELGGTLHNNVTRGTNLLVVDYQEESGVWESSSIKGDAAVRCGIGIVTPLFLRNNQAVYGIPPMDLKTNIGVLRMPAIRNDDASDNRPASSKTKRRRKT